MKMKAAVVRQGNLRKLKKVKATNKKKWKREGRNPDHNERFLRFRSER